jgi:hypothetical protein
MEADMEHSERNLARKAQALDEIGDLIEHHLPPNSGMAADDVVAGAIEIVAGAIEIIETRTNRKFKTVSRYSKHDGKGK